MPLDLPPDFLLSVIVPIYNERETIAEVVARVRAAELPCELILVDDASRDGTRELLASWPAAAALRIVLHETNRGKGAAVRTGLAEARGTAVIVQDADTEYDPQEIWQLLPPLVRGEADVVYGSRFAAGEAVSPWWHRAANGLITWVSNRATGLALTDVETCYKLIRRDCLTPLLPLLAEEGFGIELELTGRLARQTGIRFAEVPISYHPRWYEAGKKIGWRDGFWALWCAIRY
jgi:glycosyltransferase involved in cell wall biosynthesis